MVLLMTDPSKLIIDHGASACSQTLLPTQNLYSGGFAMPLKEPCRPEFASISS